MRKHPPRKGTVAVKSSWCGECERPIQVGERLDRRDDGRGWVHLACMTGRRKANRE